MPWVRVRLAILLVVLVLLSGWLLDRYWNKVVPWPVHCTEQPPTWLPMLTAMMRQLDYPGYQFSIRQPSGTATHCAAGWAAQGLTLTRLTPEHRLRYASLSKVFTSIVASQLIAEGLLDIDKPMLNYLAPEVSALDPRIHDITVGQLLRHTAGFDRSLTADPMMQALPWCPAQLESLKHLVLDHDPGSHYAYSNLGYCLLGAVIEEVAEMPLHDVFKRRVFSPAGVDSISMAETGKHQSTEPDYGYDAPDTSAAMLNMPYAHMVATGAWIGTSKAFLQVLEKTFSNNGQALLDARSQVTILAVDHTCDTSRWRACHGNGFYSYQLHSDAPVLYWRDGSLPGVTTFAGLMEDGSMFVLLANGRKYGWMKANDRIGNFIYKYISRGSSGQSR